MDLKTVLAVWITVKPQITLD